MIERDLSVFLMRKQNFLVIKLFRGENGSTRIVSYDDSSASTRLKLERDLGKTN